MNISDDLAKQIKSQRILLGKKQSEMALDLGVTTTTISALEKGKLKGLKEETLIKLLHLLQLDSFTTFNDTNFTIGHGSILWASPLILSLFSQDKLPLSLASFKERKKVTNEITYVLNKANESKISVYKNLTNSLISQSRSNIIEKNLIPMTGLEAMDELRLGNVNGVLISDTVLKEYKSSSYCKVASMVYTNAGSTIFTLFSHKKLNTSDLSLSSFVEFLNRNKIEKLNILNHPGTISSVHFETKLLPLITESNRSIEPQIKLNLVELNLTEIASVAETINNFNHPNELTILMSWEPCNYWITSFLSEKYATSKINALNLDFVREFSKSFQEIYFEYVFIISSDQMNLDKWIVKDKSIAINEIIQSMKQNIETIKEEKRRLALLTKKEDGHYLEESITFESFPAFTKIATFFGLPISITAEILEDINFELRIHPDFFFMLNRNR